MGVLPHRLRDSDRARRQYHSTFKCEAGAHDYRPAWISSYEAKMREGLVCTLQHASATIAGSNSRPKFRHRLKPKIAHYRLEYRRKKRKSLLCMSQHRKFAAVFLLETDHSASLRLFG